MSQSSYEKLVLLCLPRQLHCGCTLSQVLRYLHSKVFESGHPLRLLLIYVDFSMVDGLFLRSVGISFNSLCILGVKDQKIVLTPRCQSGHLLSSGHFLIVNKQPP